MSSTLVSVLSTSSVRTARVEQETFDVYLDPCAYLQSVLLAEVRTEMNVPVTSTVTCLLQSLSILSSGRRRYVWNVTASWTE